MHSEKKLLRGLSAALVTGSMVLSIACGGGKKPASFTPTPMREESPGPPVFQKVPPAENPAIVQPPAGTEPAAGSNLYTLEVEDELDISVYGENDLQHVLVPVRPDGMISFAFIGDVPAAGRTVEEVRTDMTSKLGQFLRSPHVTVIAKQFAQKRVYIGGEVKSPGILYLKGREGTLLDALYKAGLTTDKADLREAYLMRANRLVDADFEELVLGNVSANLRLMDRDLIYIPQNTRRFVYVIGEVASSQAIEATEPVSMIYVITKAGGFKEYAKRGEIAVIRGGLKNPSMAVVNVRHLLKGDLSQNIEILPGDIVYVAKSALGHYAAFMDQVYRGISLLYQRNLLAESLNSNTVRIRN